MYIVKKEKGNNSNVILENTDTKASIVIGRLSLTIVKTLKGAGVEFADPEDTETTALQYKDEWKIEVDDEVGKALAKTTMPMHRPLRTKEKKCEQPTPEPEKPKIIDAMDVLLGLASYK